MRNVPEPSQNFPAAHFGHHHVQDDKVVFLPGNGLQTVAARVDRVNNEPVVAKIANDHFTEISVIIDQDQEKKAVAALHDAFELG